MESPTMAFFDPDGNLHIKKSWFHEILPKLKGKLAFYLAFIKAKSNPQKSRKEIREILGIGNATEWRWRKELKEKGYL